VSSHTFAAAVVPRGTTRPGLATRALRSRAARWISPLLLLVIWQLASASGLLSPKTLAAPTEILSTAWDLTKSGDLPQALLAVISDDDFADTSLMASRRRDHERIDGVLSSRVAAEDAELAVHGRSFTDRVLQPLNRISSKRFLRESRMKVWHNTTELQAARLAGAASYDVRLGELEVLSAARIADLLAPGQVLLRLAVAGFGVTLPPAG